MNMQISNGYEQQKRNDYNEQCHRKTAERQNQILINERTNNTYGVVLKQGQIWGDENNSADCERHARSSWVIVPLTGVPLILV